MVPRKPRDAYMNMLKPRVMKGVIFFREISATSLSFVVTSSIPMSPEVMSSGRCTVLSSHAQRSPMSSPNVAVEKPRSVNCFMRVSTKMKKQPMKSPPRIPIQICAIPKDCPRV